MDGVNLTHSAALCDSNRQPDCATWVQPFEPCVFLYENSHSSISVSTFSKCFHREC